MRSRCGTRDGEPVLFELRLNVKEPTAAMLRSAVKALTMQAEWWEEDEARARAPAIKVSLPTTSVTRGCKETE